MIRRLDLSARALARHALATAGAGLAPLVGPRILMYHRVSGHDHRLAVRPDLFRRHLDHLQATGHCVVSIGDLLASLPTAGPRTVALSFDDGYLEMATVVAPELRARGFGATFFVLPRFADHPGDLAPDAPWSGRVEYLTAEMIVDLDRQGFELAAHGRRHHVLTNVEAEIAWDEVHGSRHELESLLGHPVAGFAYPRGCHDASHAAMAERAGFRWAATVAPGVVTATVDPYRLPRTEVAGGDGVATLAARLRGGLDHWHRWRQGRDAAGATGTVSA